VNIESDLQIGLLFFLQSHPLVDQAIKKREMSKNSGFLGSGVFQAMWLLHTCVEKLSKEHDVVSGITHSNLCNGFPRTLWVGIRKNEIKAIFISAGPIKIKKRIGFKQAKAMLMFFPEGDATEKTYVLSEHVWAQQKEKRNKKSKLRY